MNYEDFIRQRQQAALDAGFEPHVALYPDGIFEHQAACVTWACRRGRAALFLDTGLGKTITQLTWADQVCWETDKPVLVLTPLAVAKQTEREANRFKIKAEYIDRMPDILKSQIYITNYEKLHHFDASQFSGIVLDESSILKGMDGRMRKQITEAFSKTPYRLSCTATPSPNDFMELGTQSEFLGIMSQLEMLAMFFIHDGSDTSKWRLKGHGKSKFFRWLATWAIFMRTPADLGFESSGYDLPPIIMYSHVIETEPAESLFVEPAQGLQERNQARRDTFEDRCKKAAEIVNSLDEPCVVWCNLNDESALLAQLINESVEVRGSDSPEHKTRALLDFADAKIKCLVSKPRIAGFGMNWQSSHHCVFVGLSDSWEAYYQAIRRQWRFGQKQTVHCHVVSADVEGAVVENIRRKNEQHEELSASMMEHMRVFLEAEIKGAVIEKTDYEPLEQMIIPKWLKAS